ncbi:aminoglycoside 3'-phosphotransferase [Xylanimonas allomyrinae]|uniref:Aminoglycoside 3'-phosphotransferase n=1 Tax=Xylanimonas allomyrinae TaxID=2509459 RepID=A0A4P6EN66_9MICO|nr:aminoglycoside 3'-phosphotransferase [Xylanimonas allomyrinae]QAY63143.1 aminoglycoside 3'-phosphotransferase [Xylanimonas allomyrinae]
MTALAPDGSVRVPDAVRRLARGDRVTPVWRNPHGGLTFRLDAVGGSATPTRFVKWSRTGLAAEADRLRWAAPWTPVPRVLAHGTAPDDTSPGGEPAEYLVTAAVPGRSAVDPRWLAAPATAARALGEGLRAMHDALPVAACPFDWGVRERLARLSPEVGPEVRARLRDVPDVDRLVVCHGDACAPNTLLDDDGRWCAHVDLGRLGAADRWADLAVAAMSTTWNYGPGFGHLVYEGYGVVPDAARIAYYRLLWDST